MRFQRAIAAWVFVWLAVAGWLAFASDTLAADSRDRDIGQFYHTAWTVREGAPGQVTALAQTRDGYLWLGTQTGLYRFDGVRFERYRPRQGGDFQASSVASSMRPLRWRLWVGFRYGVASFVDGDRAPRITRHRPACRRERCMPWAALPTATSGRRPSMALSAWITSAGYRWALRWDCLACAPATCSWIAKAVSGWRPKMHWPGCRVAVTASKWRHAEVRAGEPHRRGRRRFDLGRRKPMAACVPRGRAGPILPKPAPC